MDDLPSATPNPITLASPEIYSPSSSSPLTQRVAYILSSAPRSTSLEYIVRSHPYTTNNPSYDDSKVMQALYDVVLGDHENWRLFLSNEGSLPTERDWTRHHPESLTGDHHLSAKEDKHRRPNTGLLPLVSNVPGSTMRHPRPSGTSQVPSFVTTHPVAVASGTILNPFQIAGVNPSSGIQTEPRWTLSAAQKNEKINGQGVGREVPKRKGAICGAYMRKGEHCFNCKTCATDTASVMCSSCFFASDHTGHDVTLGVAYTSSGYCDCGDTSSWLLPSTCSNHPPVDSKDDPSSNSLTAIPPSIQVHPKFERTLHSTIQLAIEYIVKTLRRAPVPTSKRPPTSLSDLFGSGVRWEDIQTATSNGKTVKGKQVGNSPFSIVLWTDEKHTIKEIARQILHATACTSEQAKRLVCTLETVGRVVVVTSSDYALLLHVAHTLSQIDLTITVQPAELVYSEQLVGTLISWLADLSECTTEWDDLYLRRLIGKVLLSRSDIDDLGTTLDFDNDLPEANWVERIFCLFPKLWKNARIDFFRIFVRVLSSDMEMKLQIGNSFAQVYHRMVNQYIFWDREPELSMLLWGAQILPIPDVAASTVNRVDFLTKIMQVLISYFTEQHNGQTIVWPPRAVSRVNADVASFRTKKWQVITQHLKTILHAQKVRNQVMANESSFDTVLSFLELFMGMAPQVRVLDEHVEYESDSWIRALGVSMDLSRVTALLGRGAHNLSTDQWTCAIRLAAAHISKIVKSDYPSFPALEYKDVWILGRNRRIIDFDVSSNPISLHNPLHWTLAELLKHAILHPDIDIRELLPEDALAIIEYPLRTITYLAQVRAGMWVRNGIGMRGQLHHYRDHPLRETTYDLDILMVQAGLCLEDPDTVLASLIDRFGLRSFFAWEAWTSDIDATQQAQMVEEFFIILIIAFSETWAFLDKSLQDHARREILHHLCLGPISYSEMTKKLSEKTVDIPAYRDMILDVANFKEPTGNSDSGTYELKSECFAEVNPFFHHFTRNQQGEAYEALLKHRRMQGSEDTVIMPNPIQLPPKPSIFSHLLDIFQTPSVIEICCAALHNAIQLHKMAPSTPRATVLTPQTDGIVDLLLHVCMIAMTEEPAKSTTFAGRKHQGHSLVDYLCQIEVDDDYESQRPKVSAILDIIQFNQSDIPRRLPETKEVTAEEARRAAVKARQNAILADFSKNQQQFIDNYGDESDEEDIEEVTSFGPCIVCQEECNANRPSGLLSNLQPSKLLRELCVDRDWFEECLRIPARLNGETRKVLDWPLKYPDGNQKFGLLASACGHLMHDDCLGKFFSDTEFRQRQQGQRNHPENAWRQEFVCPLCKSIGNMLIPLTTPSVPETKTRSLAEWIRVVSDDSLRNVKSGANIWSGYLRSGELLAFFASSLKKENRFTKLVVAASTQATHLHTRGDLGLYIPEHVIGYTIAMTEVAQRGQAGQDTYLSDTTERLIRGLVSMLTPKDSNNSIRRICLFARLLPDWFRPSPLTSPLLHRDALAIVIEAAALCPDILHPIITMCYYLELARTMLALTFWAKICMARPPYQNWSTIPCEDAKPAKAIFPKPRNMILSTFRHSPQLYHEAMSALATVSDDNLSRLLYSLTLPFLRRVTILTTCLKTKFASSPSDESEYKQLLTCLAIPLPEQSLLEPASTLASIVPSWIKQWMQSRAPLPTLEYPGIYELYRIPSSLEAILRTVSKKICKTCHKEPLWPALCYYCGEFLCLGSDCCAQGELGECNLHRMSCGGATGIFIDIRRWSALYLYGGTGSYGPMPFLDIHGEIDQGIRRGHPQFLNRPRADELRKVWLTGGIPSFIARKLELTLDQGGWTSM